MLIKLKEKLVIVNVYLLSYKSLNYIIYIKIVIMYYIVD